jgi:hypothetical protein
VEVFEDDRRIVVHANERIGPFRFVLTGMLRSDCGNEITLQPGETLNLECGLGPSPECGTVDGFVLLCRQLNRPGMRGVYLGEYQQQPALRIGAFNEEDMLGLVGL